MERGKAWRGYPALSKPLTIMGVERRWFLLIGERRRPDRYEQRGQRACTPETFFARA